MEKKRLIIIIVSIVLAGLLVVGGTFAYWTWTSNSSENTIVTFTVPNGSSDLKAILDADSMEFSNLAPAIDCSGTYSQVATITVFYENLSTLTAQIDATLSLDSITKPHAGDLDKSQIHWGLSTNSKTTCKAGMFAAGTLNGISDGGTIYNGNISVKSIATNTSLSSKVVYLYVWIDSNYNIENVGNSIVNDPMQDMTVKLVWSGQITNEISTTSKTIYTLSYYGVENYTEINELVPANVMEYNSPDLAMQAWQYKTDSVKPFYLKHTTLNGVVQTSSVEFVVSPALVADNSGMQAGTYTLVGGDGGSSFASNIALIKTAFGYSTDASRCSGDEVTDFTCMVNGLRATAYASGRVRVNSVDYACYVYDTYSSKCLLDS